MSPLLQNFIDQATCAAVQDGKSIDSWKRAFATMLVHLVVTECAAVVDSLTEESYGVANRWATGDDLIKHFEGEPQ